jgi:hypothetical protein
MPKSTIHAECLPILIAICGKLRCRKVNIGRFGYVNWHLFLLWQIAIKALKHFAQQFCTRFAEQKMIVVLNYWINKHPIATIENHLKRIRALFVNVGVAFKNKRYFGPAIIAE